MRLYFAGLDGFMKRLFVIAAFLFAGFAGAASAQTLEQYQQRHKDLATLSTVFGELHAIRRGCEPRFEGDVWRERMKKLLELEQPQPALEEEMIAGFNRGYRRAQQRFSQCTRRARDYAAARAAQGEAVVDRLMAPLYAAAEEDAPFIWVAPEEGRTDNPDTD